MSYYGFDTFYISNYHEEEHPQNPRSPRSVIKTHQQIKEDLPELEAEGKVIYHSNEVMKDIANIMNHPEFSKFFDKYFKDWTSVQCMLMLMKVHQEISSKLPKASGFSKLSLLFRLINDSTFRPKLVSALKNWMETNIISEKDLIINI